MDEEYLKCTSIGRQVNSFAKNGEKSGLFHACMTDFIYERIIRKNFHPIYTLNSKRKYTLLDLSSTQSVVDLRKILGMPNIPCEVGTSQLWR